MMMLRVVLYNALSLVAAGRIQAIAAESMADIVLMTGTRIRALTGRQFHVDTLMTGETIIHFGWSRAPFSNRSAGVAILLSGRFRPEHIVAIQAAPREVQGRAGTVRLKSHYLDLELTVGYPPPPGGTQAAGRLSTTEHGILFRERVFQAPRKAPGLRQ